MTLKAIQGHVRPLLFKNQHIRLLTDFNGNLFECKYHEDTIFSFNYI